MRYRTQCVAVYLVGREGVLFEDDSFGCGVGNLIANGANVCSDFSKCGLLMVVIADVDDVNDCIEEEFMGGVLSFSWASEKGVYYLQGSEGVGCDFEVVVALELDERHVYGGKFCPEYDVVFLEACSIDHDGSVGGWVCD